jgi:NhaC family Na+:H+ antiporter
MGVALIGIGKTLGIPVEMVAGAVISGSYFGDKLSPLSDTTNLAPAMAGSELFEHIKYMLYTTLPSICTALVIFFFMGLQFSTDSIAPGQIDVVLETLSSQFNINGWLFLAPLLVLFLVYKKVPALPAMFLGILAGVVLALIFQPQAILGQNEGSISFYYKGILKVAADGFSSSSNNPFIDDLLSRGGMSSMLSTVWLIITAMFFGGMMEACGYLQKIAATLLQLVRGTASLVGATLASCIFLNITASDQYLSIVVAGRMFREAYEKFGLAPVNLSRSLEDGGTVTSVLVPWNSGGAYFSSILGVATTSYLPFCFFNLLSPIFSLLVAALGIKILKDPRKVK